MKTTEIIRPLIIGLSIVLTAIILANAIKNRNVSKDSISVTGLSTKNFTSDKILFSGSFSTNAMDAKEAFSEINKQKEQIKTFFLTNSFKENEMSFSGVEFEKKYRNITVERSGEYEKSEAIFDGYTATQTISVSCEKNPELMKRIENITSQTSQLVNLGIEFRQDRLQYTYSDLPGLKHALIENASKDAKGRAEKIVSAANGKLGKLQEAGMGVFQITGTSEEVEDSYGGNFDIYNKEKVARITVRLTYALK